MTAYQISLLINGLILGFVLLSLYFMVHYRKQARQFQSDLDDTQKKLEDALGSVEDYQRQVRLVQDTQDILEDTRKELEITKGQVEYYSKQTHQVQSDLKDTQKKFEDALGSVEDYQRQVRLAQSTLEDTRKELEIAKGQVEYCSKHTRQAQADLKDTHEKLKDARDQVKNYQKQVHLAQDALKDAQKELEDSRGCEHDSELNQEKQNRALVEFAKNTILPVHDSIWFGLPDAQDPALTPELDDSDISSNIINGMKDTLKMLEQELESSGFEVVDPKDKPFNPKAHRPIGWEEREGIDPGIVLSVYRKGFLFDGRTVRFADVVVSK